VARRRSYARRRLRKSFWLFVQETKKVVVVFAGAVVLVAAYTVVAEPSSFLRGLVIGVVTTALMAAFLIMFLVTSGNALTLAGAWAEDFVNDEIKKARKRGHVWGAVPNIEVGGFDVDHLVVAPGGVFAIETKAHARRITRATANADLEQARESARKAALILQSKHVNMAQPVTPVLAVWGRNATETVPAEGRTVDGVHVVPVPALADWFGAYRTGRVAADNAATLLQRLRAFRASQHQREPSLR
jgi:hypothetical protein